MVFVSFVLFFLVSETNCSAWYEGGIATVEELDLSYAPHNRAPSCSKLLLLLLELFLQESWLM